MRKWLLRAQQLNNLGMTGKEKSPLHAQEILAGKNLTLFASSSKRRALQMQTWLNKLLRVLILWEPSQLAGPILSGCYMQPSLRTRCVRCRTFQGLRRGSQPSSVQTETWLGRSTDHP